MKLDKPYTREDYAKLAIYCNENNCHIEDKEDYLEAVENEPYVPTAEELSALRRAYRTEHCDHLTLEKIRKTALGTWTYEDERVYVNAMNDNEAAVNQMYPKKGNENV